MNPISYFKNLPKYFRVTIILTFVNLLVLALRNLIVGDSFYNFLKSNLFIGSFPTLVIAYLILKYHTKLNNFFFWFLTCLWVLFYPNCPYMISDLIHNGQELLDASHSELIIYDTMIIFSIAMLSIFYGFLSLKIMFNVFRTKYSSAFAHTAIGITIILSCLGFYMGREMLSSSGLGNGYLYSWEIFLEPMEIIKAVWNLLWPIYEHRYEYYMMILFGIVQWLLLFMFKDIGDVEAIEFIDKTK